MAVFATGNSPLGEGLIKSRVETYGCELVLISVNYLRSAAVAERASAMFWDVVS